MYLRKYNDYKIDNNIHFWTDNDEKYIFFYKIIECFTLHYVPKLIDLLNEKYTTDNQGEDDIDEFDTEISQYDIQKRENELKNHFFDDLKNFNRKR